MFAGVSLHELVPSLPVHEPLHLLTCREGMAGNTMQHSALGLLHLGDGQTPKLATVRFLTSSAGIECRPIKRDPLAFGGDDPGGESADVRI